MNPTVPRVHVRRARLGDALRIRNLHVRSIRVLCGPDYTARQIAAWSGNRPPAGYRRAMTADGERMYVATVEGRPVAFGAIRGAEVRAVYVDPPWVGRGVGRRLLRRLERDAAARRERRLWLNATLTAVDFYRREGWRRGRRAALLRGGVPIPCVRMTKRLA